MREPGKEGRDTGRQRAVTASRAQAPLTPRAVAAVGPTLQNSRLTGEHAFELIEEVGGGGGSGRGGGATVLLVEDEAPLRGVLRELLEREGFRVVEAGDGVTALDEVDRAAPSIIVLDLSLPRLDGYGVLKRLRARPATEHLPVVVLTAHGDEDCEVRVFESGADDFLTKPFRPRALTARLRALLKRGVAATEL